MSFVSSSVSLFDVSSRLVRRVTPFLIGAGVFALSSSQLLSPVAAASSAPQVAMSGANGTATFTPNAGLVALRVQVTDLSGAVLFDSGWQSATAPIVWTARGSDGLPLEAGVYPAHIEARDASGKTVAQNGSVALESATAPAQTATAQTATVGVKAAPGPITGAGTTGRIAVWTAANVLGDSLLRQSGALVIVDSGLQAQSAGGTGLQGSSTLRNGIGVSGLASNSTGAIGVRGESIGGVGVFGTTTGGTGVVGVSQKQAGVFGYTGATIGTAGLYGTAAANGTGVFGTVAGTGAGVRGQNNSSNGTGVSGEAPNGVGVLGTGVTGVRGTTPSTNANASGVEGTATATGSSAAATSAGVSGTNLGRGAGVRGNSDNGDGVLGLSKSTTAAGVHGANTFTTGIGVYGETITGVGVYGTTSGGDAISGLVLPGNGTGTGVVGVNNNTNGTGVRGISSSGTGVFGSSQTGMAGAFSGNVQITGNLRVSGTVSKGGGTFEIDHPRDPRNKILTHSFVESPEMMNIYNGNATTDKHGVAVVSLPAYFSALNRDCRYQLTTIGSFARAIVAQEVKGNRFTIRTDSPNVKVSWQVTGVRRDAWANANRFVPERDKGADRGTYLHPALFGPNAQPLRSRALTAQTPRTPQARKPQASTRLAAK